LNGLHVQSKFVLLLCLEEYFRFSFELSARKIRKIVIWRKADTPKHQNNKNGCLKRGLRKGGSLTWIITLVNTKWRTKNFDLKFLRRKKIFNRTFDWIKIRFKYESIKTGKYVNLCISWIKLLFNTLYLRRIFNVSISNRSMKCAVRRLSLTQNLIVKLKFQLLWVRSI